MRVERRHLEFIIRLLVGSSGLKNQLEHVVLPRHAVARSHRRRRRRLPSRRREYNASSSQSSRGLWFSSSHRRAEWSPVDETLRSPRPLSTPVRPPTCHRRRSSPWLCGKPPHRRLHRPVMQESRPRRRTETLPKPDRRRTVAMWKLPCEIDLRPSSIISSRRFCDMRHTFATVPRESQAACLIPVPSHPKGERGPEKSSADSTAAEQFPTMP